MPVVVGAVDDGVEANLARRAGIVDVIEEQQHHTGGAPAEQAEVDPSSADGGPEGGADSDILHRVALRIDSASMSEIRSPCCRAPAAPPAPAGGVGLRLCSCSTVSRPGDAHVLTGNACATTSGAMRQAVPGKLRLGTLDPCCQVIRASLLRSIVRRGCPTSGAIMPQLNSVFLPHDPPTCLDYLSSRCSRCIPPPSSREACRGSEKAVGTRVAAMAVHDQADAELPGKTGVITCSQRA